MAEVTKELVKELREKTGAGMNDCRKALIENNCDTEKAVEWLREKGIAGASKKSARTAKEGLIYSYIHSGGKVGVLVEVNCETDFVARTEDFQNLCKEISMQIAAMSPLYVTRNEVPEDLIEKEKKIFMEQMKDSGKPENVLEKIVEGKIGKFFQEICLYEQAYVKEDKKNIEEMIKENIATIGENIVVKRFARYALGEK
ncbi:MAG: translation elongation factor Ts [Candidatus Goldiibacteriota bacterium]